jgi:hypothetical protein
MGNTLTVLPPVDREHVEGKWCETDAVSRRRPHQRDTPSLTALNKGKT